MEVKCIGGLYPVKLSTGMTSTTKALTTKLGTSTTNFYGGWHDKLGHISSDRYQRLSSLRNGVPTFAHSVTTKYECIPCLTGKMQKATIQGTSRTRREDFEEIHYDLSGPITPSLGGNVYAAHFMEPTTAVSDVKFLKHKGELANQVRNYVAEVESRFSSRRIKFIRIRCNNAKENMPGDLMDYLMQNGIAVYNSPPYAPESNGLIERLVQEHWSRGRLLLFSSKLPQTLWAEALYHANWLRNRTPSSRLGGDLPILCWDPKNDIDCQGLHTFGQAGYAFIYYPPNVAGKKFLPRSEFCHFIGIESDTRLLRVFVPQSDKVRTARQADFHRNTDSSLPSFSSLADGISRQRQLDEAAKSIESEAEEYLLKSMTAIHSTMPIAFYNRKSKESKGLADGPPLPTSFEEACTSPNWAAAIDREYDALIRRETREFIPRTAEMNTVSFKWAWRAKRIDEKATSFLYKARCVLMGDLQEPFYDFDPDNLYASVGSHKSFRLMLNLVAQHNLLLEGADVSNAYLHELLISPSSWSNPRIKVDSLKSPDTFVYLKSLFTVPDKPGIFGDPFFTTTFYHGLSKLVSTTKDSTS